MPDDASCQVGPARIAFEESDIAVLETVGDVEVCIVLLDETLEDVTVTVLVDEDTATGNARRDYYSYTCIEYLV